MGFKDLNDKQLMGLTIFGEARGESTQGKFAVGSVILERVKRGGWFGKTIQTVILLPYQFSCYLPNDPNYKVLLHIADNWDTALHDKNLHDCYDIACALIDGKVQPNIVATHYKTNNSFASWEKSMRKVGQIGNHSFYV